jgi:hypothetical protein
MFQRQDQTVVSTKIHFCVVLHKILCGMFEIFWLDIFFSSHAWSSWSHICLTFRYLFSTLNSALTQWCQNIFNLTVLEITIKNIHYLIITQLFRSKTPNYDLESHRFVFGSNKDAEHSYFGNNHKILLLPCFAWFSFGWLSYHTVIVILCILTLEWIESAYSIA